MTSEEGGLEFVNRENELAFLDRCFADGAQSPALVVLKAPSGFGKSRLIDRFRTNCDPDNRVFCVIDPSVRARPGSALPQLEQLLRDYVVDAPYELNTEAYLTRNDRCRHSLQIAT